MNRHARDIVTIRHARKRLRILSLLALALALQPDALGWPVEPEQVGLAEPAN